jgi:hypothetical protein
VPNGRAPRPQVLSGGKLAPRLVAVSGGR